MAHDFAKQRSSPDAKRKRSASRPAQAGNAGWSWFFSGLMTGVIVSIAAYLAVLKLEEGVAEDAQVAQESGDPADEPTFTYGFYDRLSNAEVPVAAPAAAGTEATPAAPVNETAASSVNAAPATQTVVATEERATRYLLQAGSFQNKAGAESRRTSILLLNMNAYIIEDVVGGRTLYGVRVGPFAGRQAAEDARDILSSNDIESIPLLVPQ